jgi:hypothetical protein
MDKNDRRYLMTDISIKKMDDVEYFNKVYSILNNEFYQKVFYFWCKDFAQKNEFNELAELKKIDSDAKTEVIIKHLHPFYLYLKNRYVLKKKPVDIFLTKLTADYNKEKNSNSSVVEISRYMKEIGIDGKASTGNRKRFKIDYEDLYNVFKKNKWIHEIEENEIRDDDDDDEPEVMDVETLKSDGVEKRLKEMYDKITRLEDIEKKYNDLLKSMELKEPVETKKTESKKVLVKKAVTDPLKTKKSEKKLNNVMDKEDRDYINSIFG